jgi:elongation factor P--(R)-beta-lysine ligase
MKLYSLARFYSAWQLQTLPEKFKLGGRLVLKNGEATLAGPPVTLHLPKTHVIQSLKTGDWVTITVERTAVSAVDQSLKIEKIIEIALSLRPVAPILNSAEGERLFELSAQWSNFLNTVRGYFTTQGLSEVQTPTLVQNPGMEPELEPFSVQFKQGSQFKTLFLPTSPELHIKQLMVNGLTDVFEIKNVFRNEEFTDVHQPEFTMLEWYRGFADLEMIKQDLAQLLEKLKIHKGPIQEFSVADFFKKHFDFKLTPQTSREDLHNLAANLKLQPSVSFDFNDLFHLIWVAKIEPDLPMGAFILKHYPPSQAALAKLTPDGWADRFELYWNHVEIANAFHELNDASEQRRRFLHDQKKRIEYGRTPLEIDENFMTALEQGLPPSAGIALGLDRLFMVANEIQNISQARLFSVSHQLKK